MKERGRKEYLNLYHKRCIGGFCFVFCSEMWEAAGSVLSEVNGSKIARYFYARGWGAWSHTGPRCSKGRLRAEICHPLQILAKAQELCLVRQQLINTFSAFCLHAVFSFFRNTINAIQIAVGCVLYKGTMN